ncbi:hypothetical protein QOT17_009234 [Balamuthia mandrillaris]
MKEEEEQGQNVGHARPAPTSTSEETSSPAPSSSVAASEEAPHPSLPAPGQPPSSPPAASSSAPLPPSPSLPPQRPVPSMDIAEISPTTSSPPPATTSITAAATTSTQDASHPPANVVEELAAGAAAPPVAEEEVEDGGGIYGPIREEDLPKFPPCTEPAPRRDHWQEFSFGLPDECHPVYELGVEEKNHIREMLFKEYPAARYGMSQQQQQAEGASGFAVPRKPAHKLNYPLWLLCRIMLAGELCSTDGLPMILLKELGRNMTKACRMETYRWFEQASESHIDKEMVSKRGSFRHNECPPTVFLLWAITQNLGAPYAPELYRLAEVCDELGNPTYQEMYDHEHRFIGPKVKTKAKSPHGRQFVKLTPRGLNVAWSFRDETIIPDLARLGTANNQLRSARAEKNFLIIERDESLADSLRAAAIASRATKGSSSSSANTPTRSSYRAKRKLVDSSSSSPSPSPVGNRIVAASSPSSASSSSSSVENMLPPNKRTRNTAESLAFAAAAAAFVASDAVIQQSLQQQQQATHHDNGSSPQQQQQQQQQPITGSMLVD